MKNDTYKSKYQKYKLKYLNLKGGAAFRNQGESKIQEKTKSVREITLTNINENKEIIIDIFTNLKNQSLTEEDVIQISRLQGDITLDNLDVSVNSIQYLLKFINSKESDDSKKILFVGFRPDEIIKMSIDNNIIFNTTGYQFKFFYEGNFFKKEDWNFLNNQKFDYIIFDHGMHWNESIRDKREFPSFTIWSHLKKDGIVIVPKENSKSDYYTLNLEFQLFRLQKENLFDPVTRVNLATHNRVYFNVYKKMNF